MNDDALLQRIAHHEGLRLKAYQDPMGIWTIGYGRNLEAMGLSKEEASTKTCTIWEAKEWLKEDVEFAKAIAVQTPEWPCFDTDGRRGVWVEMIFNLGWTKLKRFTNTRLAISDHDWESAAKHMLDSLWAKQVKGRAVTLAKVMRMGW
jgi:lysozyme